MPVNSLSIQFLSGQNIFRQITLAGIIVLLAACGGVSSDVGTDNGGASGTGGTGGTGGSTPSPFNYEWDTLAVSKLVYVDRDYTYSNIPAAYIGVQYLRTANNDKNSTGSSFLDFEVDSSVDVYVGHAEDEINRPSWLSTWEWTGETLITTDRTLYLYKKTFNAGTVTLSGNESGNSMYVVIVDGGTISGGGTGGGVATPIANNDSATTDQLTAVNINVLTNDTGLNDSPLTVNIVQAPSSGSTVVETNNTVTYTPNGSFAGTDSFTYSVTDADGDMATATVNVAVSSVMGGGIAVPFANDDNASTDQLTAVNIAVLTNDTGLDDAPLTIGIVQAPAGGTTTVEADNSITYTPNGTFAGTDMFIYSVTDADGDMATATVNLAVICATCATGVNVTFNWNANPTSDSIIGYRVYAGTTLATATTEISNLTANSSGFNVAAPSVTYDAWSNLGLSKGDALCFRLKAYNAAGTSGFSTGVCDVIPN